MFEEDIPKYRKKSKGNGQPRAKHKHEYQTVLLVTKFELPEILTGKTKQHERKVPTRVCQVCGRVDYIDHDPSFYDVVQVKALPYYVGETKLSQKALNLPVWILKADKKFAEKLEITL